MSINVPIVLVALFILKHLVCDWLLQNHEMALHKSKFLHPAGIIHALINGVGTAVVIAIAAPTAGFAVAIWLGVADMFSHYAIDYMKANANKAFKLEPGQSLYWKLIAIDQTLHWIIYLIFMSFIGGLGVTYGPSVFLIISFSVITVGVLKKTIRE